MGQAIVLAPVTDTRERIRSNLQSTVRDLQRRKARGRRGLAVVEGVRLVEEALLAGLEFKGALVSPELARTPQGILAIVQPRMWALTDIAGGPMLVVDGVQDPGNVGTLIRTAHALGASASLLLDDAPFIAWAREHGVTLWAAAADGVLLDRAIDSKTARKELIAVIVGNEGAGIRPQLNAVAAQRVAIPLARGAESLNVAVAAGILLYEVVRGR